MTTTPVRPQFDLRFVQTKAMIPSGKNPRRTFDAERAEELERSIGRRGVIQTVALIPLPPERRAEIFDLAKQRLPEDLARLLPAPENLTHEIVAGERRWRAALKTKVAELPSLIYRDIDPALLIEIMLTENFHREPVSTWDLANFLSQTFTEMRAANNAIRQTDLAERFDVTQSQISQCLALLNAPHDVQKLVRSDKIALAPAIKLAKITNQNMRRHFATLLMDEELPQTEWMTVVGNYITHYERGEPKKIRSNGAPSGSRTIIVPVNVTRTTPGGGTTRITGSVALPVVPASKGPRCLCHLCPIHGKKGGRGK